MAISVGIISSSFFRLPAPVRVFAGHQTTPFLSSYAWTNASGWGTKSANPATLMPGNSLDININPVTQNSLVAGHSGSPYISGYAITSSGFGTKYADPAVIPPTSTTPARGAYSVEFHPLANIVGVVSSGTPYVNAYSWTDASGFGTKFANPATAAGPINANGQTFAFSNAGDVAVYGSITATAGLQGYQFNTTSGFGTKFTNVNVGSLVPALRVTKSRNHVVITKNVAPYIEIHPFTTAGFGTKFADPVTASTLNATALSVTPDDAATVMTAGTAARSYQINESGFGTAFAAAATYTGATSTQVIGFDGLSSFQGSNASPFIFAYPFSSSTGFGTRYAAPSVLPAGQVNGIDTRS